ncbi:MAG: amino acid aminotransferase [Pseudohongiellaceae bacterium]
MFETLDSLPADPILGLMKAFQADENPRRIDLGVGVYKDDNGNTPVMRAVKQAEQHLFETQDTKRYVGPTGSAGFNQRIAELVLGPSLVKQLGGRRVTVQTPGGCGGLRLASEFIRRAAPQARVLVSDPTWANHVPLLGDAGLRIETYPYYDKGSHNVRFDAMMDTLGQAGPGDVVLLHGSCHNPCGADLDKDQWQAVCDLALQRGFLPFIDLAYQGLGDGLDEDTAGVRLLAENLPELVVVNSCSKNFGLYRERAGALTVIGQNAEQTAISASQIASIARGIWSMPPDHGAAIVETILADDVLKQVWLEELGQVRRRINDTRALLATALDEAGVNGDFRFITREKGMFSFLGISKEEVRKLVDQYSIYLVDSSRINVAGINSHNMDYLVQSLKTVLTP